MAGKFELKKGKTGKFSFNLKSGNGQVVFTSQTYDNKRSATAGISSVKKNAASDARFERKTSTKGQPFFVIKATNGQTIGKSQMYANAVSMEKGIKSVATNAPSAETNDLTVEAPKPAKKAAKKAPKKAAKKAKAAPKKKAAAKKKAASKPKAKAKKAVKKAPKKAAKKVAKKAPAKKAVKKAAKKVVKKAKKVVSKAKAKTKAKAKRSKLGNSKRQVLAHLPFFIASIRLRPSPLPTRSHLYPVVGVAYVPETASPSQQLKQCGSGRFFGDPVDLSEIGWIYWRSDD